MHGIGHGGEGGCQRSFTSEEALLQHVRDAHGGTRTSAHAAACSCANGTFGGTSDGTFDGSAAVSSCGCGQPRCRRLFGSVAAMEQHVRDAHFAAVAREEGEEARPRVEEEEGEEEEAEAPRRAVEEEQAAEPWREEGALNRWSVVSQPSLSTRHRDAEAQWADEEGMMTLMANIAAKRTEMDALVDDQGAAGEEMGREEGERAAWRGVAEESIAANIMAMITRSPVSSGSD